VGKPKDGEQESWRENNSGRDQEGASFATRSAVVVTELSTISIYNLKIIVYKTKQENKISISESGSETRRIFFSPCDDPQLPQHPHPMKRKHIVSTADGMSTISANGSDGN
jgi:hypothetical protein